MATISFIPTFNLNTSPKIFTAEDTSDYAGQGISTANVNGCLRIVAPSGTVIYNNTDYSDSGCDIRNFVSEFTKHSIPLPLNIDGLPEDGLYTITYTVYDKNLLVYSTVTGTYTYNYVRPLVVIEQTVDCLSPYFISKDITNYTINGTVPSVLTRTHSLYFPNGSNGQGSPIVTTGSTINAGANQFYNGVQTSVISTVLLYSFSDGLIVSDTVSLNQNATVDCVSLCNIRCCLNDLEQRMSAQKCNNNSKYEETRDLFSQVMGLVGLINLNISCGDGSLVNDLITLIEKLTNCTSNCTDCGSEGSPVLGLGTVLNNVVVDAGDSSVTVTAVVAGTLTTYSVKMNNTLLSKINDSYNTVVSAGKNVSVADSGVVAGVRTYTVKSPISQNLSFGSFVLAGHLTPSFDEVCTFIFAGTNNIPAIQKFIANMFVSDSANTATIRIYDVTNSAVVATSSGTTSTSTNNIIDLGVISNLPVTQALFSIQIQNSSPIALDTVTLKSLLIGTY